jgi:hypothetical protein
MDFKFMTDAGFLCGSTTTTARVLRDMINVLLCVTSNTQNVTKCTCPRQN